MKKYLILVLLFASSLAYSQKNDTCDYFSIGVYGGSYISSGPLISVNNFLNSVVVEMEYRKTKDFSFFSSVLYQFTEFNYNSVSVLNLTPIVSPETHKGIVTLGGKYYLSANKVNTFVQLGLSQEYNYEGSYSYSFGSDGQGKIGKNSSSWFYQLSLLAGAGINFKLHRKLLFEFQYNYYRNIEANNGSFVGFTLYGGLKYNLF